MDKPSKCPKCDNVELTPFRDKWICLKCMWGTKDTNCDSCNGTELYTYDCGCVQCKSCPRINPQYCDDHIDSIPEKTFIEGTGERLLKWFKKDKHRLFILNGNQDIVYAEHNT